MSETSSRVRLMANLQAAVAEAVSGTMEERGRGFASDREAWAELKECIERTKQMHTDIEKVHKEMWRMYYYDCIVLSNRESFEKTFS